MVFRLQQKTATSKVNPEKTVSVQLILLKRRKSFFLTSPSKGAKNKQEKICNLWKKSIRPQWRVVDQFLQGWRG